MINEEVAVVPCAASAPSQVWVSSAGLDSFMSDLGFGFGSDDNCDYDGFDSFMSDLGFDSFSA